jgi:hypothetical protein
MGLCVSAGRRYFNYARFDVPAQAKSTYALAPRR